MTEEVKKLLRLGVLLSAERDMDQLLRTILECMMDLARCDAGTLYLLEDGTLRAGYVSNRSQSIDGIPPVPLDRENVCALAFLEGRAVAVDDVYSCGEYNFSGPIRYDALTGYRTRSMLAVPMVGREGEKIGVLQLINALDDAGQACPFPEEMTLVLQSAASQAAVTIQNVRYLEQVRQAFRSFVRVMSAAIGELTPYNASHTRHMAACCQSFLDYLDAQPGREPYSAARRDELLMSVWLHDVGKLVTPLEVMNKAGRLTPEQRAAVAHRLETIRLLGRIEALSGGMDQEQYAALAEQTAGAWALIERIDRADFLPEEDLARVRTLAGRTYRDEDGCVRPWLTEEERDMLSIRGGTLSARERQIMQSHANLTDMLLSQIQFPAELRHVREWAASHHELLDGSGYPRHLSADQIPEEVRIITILDIFDALVAADRPYKKGKPVAKALAILRDMAGREGKLDGSLTELFAASRCWERAGYERESEG